MKSETELSDKEWRQMRRQMSKLDFDPVPETPALVPRSLYGDSDKDLVSICEERGEKPEETRESAALDDGGSTHNDSPKNRSSPNAINQEMPEKISIKIGSELPSTSMAVSPLITNRYRPREKKLSHKAKLDDADIAVLDAQMAMAQEATRRSIMGAFMELRAKKAKSEALERTELSAAHMSDVASLQRKVEDLKMQVSGAEIQREQQDLLLDRFSEFTAKQLNKNIVREIYAFACGIKQHNDRQRSVMLFGAYSGNRASDSYLQVFVTGKKMFKRLYSRSCFKISVIDMSIVSLRWPKSISSEFTSFNRKLTRPNAK
ncbi:uncharacterized protein IUM83_12588 [Phytophthora cinnamomi]|uniref:uncharacterized protein n=1 Tax=Phytophthora cinnamomi TaxID=4785 RepID=UPI003559ECDB|nr:hypothetical protein IUM83_12588 [Phytophthora cinnamomi]